MYLQYLRLVSVHLQTHSYRYSLFLEQIIFKHFLTELIPEKELTLNLELL